MNQPHPQVVHASICWIKLSGNIAETEHFIISSRGSHQKLLNSPDPIHKIAVQYYIHLLMG